MAEVPVWAIPRLTTGTVATPAANTAATVTIAASQAGRRVIRAVVWSYSATPTGGRLTITDGGTTILDIDITVGGPGPVPLEYVAGVNAAVVVTLAAGGGSVVGKLSVIHYLGTGTRWERS